MQASGRAKPRFDRLRRGSGVRRRRRPPPMTCCRVQGCIRCARRSPRAASACRGGEGAAGRRLVVDAESSRWPGRSCWRLGGMVDTVALKGVHPLGAVGQARGRGDLRGVECAGCQSRLLRGRGNDSLIARSSTRSATRASPSRRAFCAGADRQPHDHDQGTLPRRALEVAPQTTRSRCSSATRRTLSKPDGKYTSTSSPRSNISANATRGRRAEPQFRVPISASPAEIAETWRGCARRASTRSLTTPPKTGAVDVIRELHELRAVRGDQGEGRAVDDTRGWGRPAVPEHVAPGNPRRAATRRRAKKYAICGFRPLEGGENRLAGLCRAEGPSATPKPRGSSAHRKWR